VLHFGHSRPLGHQQCRAEGNVQAQGLLGMCGRLWHSLEEFNPVGHMADRFQMGRALARVLACPLPVAHRRLGAARRGVVLGDQFRLHLYECGEPGFEGLGDLLVDLLPSTLEQRRIRRVLDQGMLKHIPGPRRPPPLVEELGPH